MEVEPLKELKTFVKKYPSRRQAAMALGISDVYLNDVLAKRKNIGDKIIDALGIKKTVTYEKD